MHPDWVYCEYNSGSDKWFVSPEKRVFHFLERTRGPGWKWMSLRPRSPSSHHRQASKPDKDSYYCEFTASVPRGDPSPRPNEYPFVLGDKALVQSLVLDALVTDGFDRRSTHSMHKDDKQRYVALHSRPSDADALVRVTKILSSTRCTGTR